MLAKEKQIRVYPGSGARVFKIKIESCKKNFMGAAVEVLSLERIGPRLGRLVAGEAWKKGG